MADTVYSIVKLKVVSLRFVDNHGSLGDANLFIMVDNLYSGAMVNSLGPAFGPKLLTKEPGR